MALPCVDTKKYLNNATLSIAQWDSSKNVNYTPGWIICGNNLDRRGRGWIRDCYRDVERLLTFYKHAAPGTIHDGDENNARWQVYKYRKKKEKLWRRLEVKYGMEVLHSHEWPDLEEEAEGEGEEEVEEMDIDEDESETSEPDL